MSRSFPRFETTEPFISPPNRAPLLTCALSMSLIASLASLDHKVNPVSDTNILIVRICAFAVCHTLVN